MPHTKNSSRTNLARLAFLAFLGWGLMALRGMGFAAAEANRRDPEGRVSAARAGLFSPRRRTRSRKRRLAIEPRIRDALLRRRRVVRRCGRHDRRLRRRHRNRHDRRPRRGGSRRRSPPTRPLRTRGPLRRRGPPRTRRPSRRPPRSLLPRSPADGATDPATSEDPAADPETPADETETPATTPDDGGATGEAARAPTPDTGSGPETSGPEHARPGPDRASGGPRRARRRTTTRSSRSIPRPSVFGASTVWLHRTLADPTPPAKRLAPALRADAPPGGSATGADWAVVLAAIRADGGNGRRARRPGPRAADGGEARRVGGQGRMARVPRGCAAAPPGPTRRRRSRATTGPSGLRALVQGLDASKGRIARRCSPTTGSPIYPGGRSDIASGKTDVRVLVLLRYLAEAHGQVTISSLTSGHRLYSRPGVVSAHVYGLAVDIAVLGNQSIYGQPAGRRHHGAGGAQHPAHAGRDQPATGDLAARPRRGVVPAGRPRRPHPRGVLDDGSPRAPERARALRAVRSRRRPGLPAREGSWGEPAMGRDEGILLRPASSIHTAFMRFPIDAVFLDENCAYCRWRQLKPWRTAGFRGARAVLELSSGESERRGVRPGDLVVPIEP